MGDVMIVYDLILFVCGKTSVSKSWLEEGIRSVKTDFLNTTILVIYILLVMGIQRNVLEISFSQRCLWNEQALSSTGFCTMVTWIPADKFCFCLSQLWRLMKFVSTCCIRHTDLEFWGLCCIWVIFWASLWTLIINLFLRLCKNVVGLIRQFWT